MSYTPTQWTTGDPITASAMNKIENGIANAGSVLICMASYDDGETSYVLDKTAQEIYDALLAGTPAYIKFQYGVLGASGTGTFSSTLYLAPIIKVYGYNYTNSITIMASKPSFSNNDYTPSVLSFTTASLGGYPVYAQSLTVNKSAMSTSDIQ